MNFLELHHLSFALENRWLIQDASLRFCPHSLTALVGPNGAGKSTLLRLLTGLWQPTSGQVTLNGKSLQTFSNRQLARHITFVSQEIPTIFAFSVQEIVAMGRHPHLKRLQRESVYDHYCITEAMRRTDVLHLAKRSLVELSSGERHRVYLARSLATEADIILLDEPTAHLDIAHTLKLFSLCHQLAVDGKTVIVAVHDLNLAYHYAQQVAVIQQGHILSHGDCNEVLTPNIIRQVFNVHVEVSMTPEGKSRFFFASL